MQEKNFAEKALLTIKELQDYTGIGKNNTYKLARESAEAQGDLRRMRSCHTAGQ